MEPILDAAATLAHDVAADPASYKSLALYALAGGLALTGKLLWLIFAETVKDTRRALAWLRSLWTPSELGRAILGALARTDRSAGERSIVAGPVTLSDTPGGWAAFVNGQPVNDHLTDLDRDRIKTRCERICGVVRRANESDRLARRQAEALRLADAARAVNPVANCSCNGCVAMSKAKRELRGGLETSHTSNPKS